ncbi:cation diffusion facilitator family transporter [Sansalvadorimonas sp. 2012CJ34-2]|uniref:Cation diffusion facilitator family transporter n=1 Tax=Parendozoicomonas callyspongiae TaxID=2942213 RepID=A0ABT0PCE7_9GAMM|nr:cation diffusion facilitator family transporter [Sansalvadorimonas sp. 2012CJ34-2]MCL6269057.1 cation diffusion facilitator family transporter [Sansalvadorimonas sp. 2012CJ34-2]
MVNNTADAIKVISRVTWVGLLVNVILSALKIIAGTLGNSRAVVADGLHSISDLVSDVAVLVGVHIWSAPADSNHPYGHQRFETLVTLFIGLMMVAAGSGIGWDAITAWHEGTTKPTGMIALVAALCSIALKEILFRWTLHKGKHVNSSALIANAWHHRSDAFSSMPAALATLGSMFLPGQVWIDIAGAGIISLLILYSAVNICAQALGSLVDRGASLEITDQLYEMASEVEGVRGIHRLRTRHHGGLFVDMHLHVDGHLTVTEGHDIALAVEALLMREGPNIIEVLIHIDPWTADPPRN